MDGQMDGRMGRGMGGWMGDEGEVFAVSFGKYLSVHNLVLYLESLLSFLSERSIFFYSYFK